MVTVPSFATEVPVLMSITCVNTKMRLAGTAGTFTRPLAG
jgi:hypothetical protein